MKKSLLTAAVIAAASGFAIAGAGNPMGVNADGIGQVLLYPYYNVNDGFSTGFTVVNTSDTYRAVKVRIIEGRNSWEVLDFNLYLSPWDVWAGALHKTAEGVPSLITSDQSCTLPVLTKDSSIPLRDPNFGFEKKYENKTLDELDITKRMSEGYIEVIDMGAVAGGGAEKDIHPLIEKISKDFNCNAFLEVYRNKWAANIDKYIKVDGQNALMGTAYVIDVNDGLSGGYNAVAIENFVTANPDGKVTMHNAPGSSFPNLNGQVQRGTEAVYSDFINTHARVKLPSGDVAVETATIKTHNTTDAKTYGEIGKSGVAPAAVTLSAALMAEQVLGEYYVDAGTASASAWVVTMPTKHFFTNPDTSRGNKNETQSVGQYGFLKDKDEKAYAPFSSTVYESLQEPVEFKIWDRDEAGHVLGVVDFSPSPYSVVSLPAESSVVNWNDATGAKRTLFESINGFFASAKFNSGWGNLSFTSEENALHGTTEDGKKFVLKGLPVIGIAASKFVNGTLEGGKVLSNYLYVTDLSYKRNNCIGTGCDAKVKDPDGGPVTYPVN